MKKILFTGATGFLGRNLVPELRKEYELFTPSRKELDLNNVDDIKRYIQKNNFDVIIHAAIPNIQSDSIEFLLRDSLRTFMQLDELHEYYEKMIYFGSGAEYDKAYPIIRADENQIGKRIPQNDYGLAKYMMNRVCRSSNNIYNFRIFGCYGPTDADFKLNTYIIHQCMKEEPIHLRQNVRFDYMYVMDLVPAIKYAIENPLKYHDYNVCSGTSIEILKMAEHIKKKMKCNVPVTVEKQGMANEYSGDNTRFMKEMPMMKFTKFETGIEKLIEFELEVKN